MVMRLSRFVNTLAQVDQEMEGPTKVGLSRFRAVRRALVCERAQRQALADPYYDAVGAWECQCPDQYLIHIYRDKGSRLYD